MSRESTLWRYLGKGMRYRWTADRHEDWATPGVPDVSFVCRGRSGWIELKVVDDWSRKKGRDGITLRHLTPEQKMFLQRRGEAGESTWLLLKVKTTYFLVDWRGLDVFTRHTSRENLERTAVVTYERRIDWGDLESRLSR